MRTSDSIAALADALSKAQSEMTGAKKSADNPFFKSKYSDLATVIESFHKPFATHGLSFVQSPGFVDGMICVTTRIMHSSGEWIEGDCILPPTKADVHGYASAISYGRRYGIQSMVGVPSVSDDDDGNAAVKHQDDTPAHRINRNRAQEYSKQIEDALYNEDALGLRQLNDELQLDEAMHKHVWNFFTTAQKTAAKALLSQAKDK